MSPFKGHGSWNVFKTPSDNMMFDLRTEKTFLRQNKDVCLLTRLTKRAASSLLNRSYSY